jgi:hypothetical protein
MTELDFLDFNKKKSHFVVERHGVSILGI